MKKQFYFLLILLLGTSYSYSATFYVNGLTGDNSFNGSSASVGSFPIGPKKTIKGAIAAAQQNDNIERDALRRLVTHESKMVRHPTNDQPRQFRWMFSDPAPRGFDAKLVQESFFFDKCSIYQHLISHLEIT